MSNMPNKSLLSVFKPGVKHGVVPVSLQSLLLAERGIFVYPDRWLPIRNCTARI